MARQNLILMSHMMRGETLTPLRALRWAGCFRLAARIYEMERLGTKIVRGWIRTKGGARVRSYRMGRR